MRNQSLLRKALANHFFSAVVSSALLLLAFTSPTLAADAERGEALSQTCLGCHGAPGLRNPGPVYEIPMVGGQHASYIVSALKDYKSKARAHKTMQAQASNLSDTDMQDIAAFFAEMEGNSRPGLTDAQSAARGEANSAVCASCHGKTGDGDNAAYPKLAGQYESYLEQALKEYRSGERTNAIMAGFADNLSIQEIRDLAAWYGKQEGGLTAPESKIFKFTD
ncbi:MAG: cytochrome c [Arenicella sp.]|nr:cytochrome c [Arenicella sp.]